MGKEGLSSVFFRCIKRAKTAEFDCIYRKMNKSSKGKMNKSGKGKMNNNGKGKMN